MKLSSFGFNLPKESIAMYPAKNRDESKLMVIDRKTKKIEHKKFKFKNQIQGVLQALCTDCFRRKSEPMV